MAESKKIKIEFDQLTVWKAGTIIFAVLFIISIFTGGFSGSDTGSQAAQIIPSQQAPPGAAPQDIIKADIDVKGEPCIGDKDADVLIVEFTDYQCPFCNRAFTTTFPEIKKLVDKGDVRYCVKDYPLPFHTEADEASLAANCAGDQKKYWEMHDTLFKNVDSWAGSSNPKDIFTGYAKDLGLDEKKFTSCMDDTNKVAEIQQDISEGSAIGVSGTPSFSINGQLLVGAQPWAAFKTIIDAARTA